MSQTIRVLAESDQPVALTELRTILPERTELVVEEGDENNWTQLLLKHRDGPEIALIEKEVVAPSEWGEQELSELVREMEQSRPRRAVEWLKHYFSHVKVVYAMQVLSGTEVNDGWLAVHRIQAYLWKKLGGILQADGEGFSNREGLHILWQFHGEQSGELEVATLNENGSWNSFTLDMADAEQVEAFQHGNNPTERKASSMQFEITPEELKQHLDNNAPLTVLDVREPWEFQAANIAGSKHIPMDQIPARVNNELDPEAHIVVVCHHGVRSANVAAWLKQQGFDQVQSLRGGIDRWSRVIDPSVPIY